VELFKALSSVIPVFIRIACGFAFPQLKRINLTSLTEIIVYLGTPSLVFSSLASKPLFAGDIAVLFGGILIIFCRGGIAHPTHRKISRRPRTGGIHRCDQHFDLDPDDPDHVLANPPEGIENLQNGERNS